MTNMHYTGLKAKATGTSQEAFKDMSALGSLHHSRERKVPRIVLVDDDPVFGRIMMKVAERERIPLTYFSSVKEIAARSSWDFDIAIVDYGLEDLTGFHLVNHLTRKGRGLPTVLISANPSVEGEKWPPSITGFVPKSQGAMGILIAAMEAYDRTKEAAEPAK